MHRLEPRGGRLRTIAIAPTANAVHWWERVPKLAGPFALALAGMDADVRYAIAQKAKLASGDTATLADGIVVPGSGLIGSGREPALRA